MRTQLCIKCSIIKDISAFEWAKDRPNPRKVCNKCRNKDRVYTTEQLHRRAEYKKIYSKTDRAKLVWERCKYGVSKQDLDYKHCLICGTTDNICIDHNHDTGKFRGLLCRNCNFGIGHFEDNVELLLKAVEYLNKNKELV